MSTDECTPTTDDVRSAYVLARWPHTSPPHRDNAADDFDRWLAARDAEVAERIAQAIEAQRPGCMLRGFHWPTYKDSARIAREAGRA